MKIRDGFVTNSSSSSFVVVMKRDVSKDELGKKLMSVFGLQKEHPLYGFAKDIVNCLYNEIGRANEYTLSEFDREYDGCAEDWRELLVKHGNLRIGSFSDDSGDAEDTKTMIF